MIRSRKGMLLSVAVVGGICAAAPAQAQSGEWRINSSEYKCLSVSRSDGPFSVAVYPDHMFSKGLPFMISMTSRTPLPSWARSAGFGAEMRYHSTNYPSHRYSATTELSGKSDEFGRNLEVPEIVLHGGRDLIDWLAGANRSFDYLYQGKVVETFTLSDFAGARAALDNCRPKVAPPNRALRPEAWTVQRWTDFDALYDVAGDQPGLGPFRANLIVNSQGNVESCTVTTSSGHAGADQVYCDVVKRNARFISATDALGKHIAATYEFKVAALTF